MSIMTISPGARWMKITYMKNEIVKDSFDYL